MKIKVGDIFEITTNKGIGYFQCVKTNTIYEVELIRVFNVLNKNNEEINIESLIKSESYFLHFHLKGAVRKKCVKYISSYPLPSDLILPRYFRSMNKIGGKLEGWYIVDSETLKRKYVTELSNEQKNLSPWGSWNDTLLAYRIACGWKLKDWL